MGILCAKWGPLETLDFPPWKQTDQMDRRGARRELPLPPVRRANGTATRRLLALHPVINPPPPCPAHNNRSTPTPPPPPGRAGTSASGNPWSGNYGNFDNFQYDVNKVGYTKKDSLGILELPLAATEREIKVQYKKLARTYHPDKFNPTNKPMTHYESQEHFKLVSIAYQFLRT